MPNEYNTPPTGVNSASGRSIEINWDDIHNVDDDENLFLDDEDSGNHTRSESAAPESEPKKTVLSGSISAYDPLSYDSILVNYRAFRQAGGRNSSSFNEWDSPSHSFFRLLFHFTDSTRTDNSTGLGDGSGLLHPSWIGMALPSQSELDAGVIDLPYWTNSSAWSYLMQNAEYIRANFLKQFIELLSNINTESPWYFQTIKGIDAAISRKQTMENFEFKDRGKITIECLEDSTDHRIGTLLDLYRSATWSWQTKRAIIPANLRKFDMSIVIISSPIRNLHTPINEKIPNRIGDAIGAVSVTKPNLGTGYASASAASGSNTHRASYKIIELHNCEIDYNSSSTGYDAVDNKEGFNQKYNIDIFFDDAIEVRYNEFLEDLAEISDLIGTDAIEPVYTDDTSNINQSRTIDATDAGQTTGDGITEQTVQTQDPTTETTMASTTNTTASRLKSFTRIIDSEKASESGILSKAANKLGIQKNNILNSVVDEIAHYGVAWVQSKRNKLMLGNLFGLSITKLGRQVQQALNGELGATIANIRNGSSSAYNGNKSIKQPYQNIFEDNIPSITDVIELGNIFRNKTLAQS